MQSILRVIKTVVVITNKPLETTDDITGRVNKTRREIVITILGE